MELKEYKQLEMLAHEGFIRRASRLKAPFMLKGSFVSRQYFQSAKDRIPADLDYVCLESMEKEENARKMFTEWATTITEMHLEDGCKFVSFTENEFWRRIDYAMADDFPTVNTDLKCFVEGKEIDFSLDISFNLDVEQPAVPLTYTAVRGDTFTIPLTVPLSLQVSWKIHQTIVRPRFKDIFDLTHLVSHPQFDAENLQKAMQALVNECAADEVDATRIKSFFTFDIQSLYPKDKIRTTWNHWRFGVRLPNQYPSDYGKAKHITNPENLPEALDAFLHNFKSIMRDNGIDETLHAKLPQPTRSKRTNNTDGF